VLTAGRSPRGRAYCGASLSAGPIEFGSLPLGATRERAEPVEEEAVDP
jgi:hypothetical protein